MINYILETAAKQFHVKLQKTLFLNWEIGFDHVPTSERSYYFCCVLLRKIIAVHSNFPIQKVHLFFIYVYLFFMYDYLFMFMSHLFVLTIRLS